MKNNEYKRFSDRRGEKRFNLNPSYMSPEWQEDYRMWYENWRRDCWNERFHEINNRNDANQ
jgi:hypothetical protein